MSNPAKTAFRKQSIRTLKSKTGISKLRNDRKLCANLNRILESLEARNVLFYLPMNLESNIHTSIQTFQKRGGNAYVPFMEGASFKMVKLRLPLKKTNNFGILEPSNSFFHLAKLEVAVVPIVGVDCTLSRIGFGKGMYDRFFASIQKRYYHRPIVIFIQNVLCYSKDVISDPHDIKADYVLTPESLFINQGVFHAIRISAGRVKQRFGLRRHRIPDRPETACRQL